MQLALVNSEIKEAFHGGRGICPLCRSKTIAKCGPRIKKHWAHYRIKNCDPWWENETLWHRNWKNEFPIECREVTHIAENGEIHRADVKTPTGIVIEIQHSPMSDAERISREEFYEKLVWVIDGAEFINNFDIYHALPDPKSEIAQDLVWAKAKRHYRGANSGMCFKVSEALIDDPNITKKTLRGGRIHSISPKELEGNYNGYHQYDWIRPRKTWLDAKCPVYIDLGEDFLARLEIYDETGLPCIRCISKQKFIHDVMIEKSPHDIATKFYPMG